MKGVNILISNDKIKAAEKCLIDNGIESEEAATVLQAIGYILLNVDLYSDVEFKNKQFYWLDNDTFCLSFDGGIDNEGDKYSYLVEYDVKSKRFIFERWYEFDVCRAGFTDQQRKKIIRMMFSEMSKYNIII